MPPKKPSKPRKPNLSRKNRKEIKRLVTLADGSTIRKSYYGETEQEAESKWREETGQLPLQGDDPGDIPGSFAWVFFNKLFPLKVGLRDRSIEDIQTTLRHVLPLLGTTQVSQIDAVVVATTCNAIGSKMILKNPRAKDREKHPEKWVPISARTVNKCRALILEVMGVAAEEFPQKVRPITSKRIKTKKDPPKRITIYTPQMLRRLYLHSQGRVCAPAVLLYGFCGLRLREGAAAHSSSLTESGNLRVETQQVKDKKQTTKDLKSASSYRVIPLPSGVHEEMKKFADPPGPLIRSLERKNNLGGDHVRAAGIAASLTRAMVSAGLPVVSTHKLRHAFSTWLESNGCPRSVRRELMGHGESSIDDTYNHPGDAVIRMWLDRLWQASMEPDTQTYATPTRKRRKMSRPAAENPRAKLSPDQVKEIRNRIGNETIGSIARAFGVSPKAIRNIRDGKAWTNLS